VDPVPYLNREGEPMPTSDLKKRIRNIPDFPKKGIQFKDITTLPVRPVVLQRAIDLMAHRHFAKGIEAVVGIEARGFVMGAAMAYKLGTGVLLVRKAGKLPYKTVAATYDLEYGRTASRSTRTPSVPG